ncbi:hypothetical protein KIN20_022347 [Parelaphostrongylus tenuis]|uniref:Uncharacterized protein n=1 Tax=Parelaphostrongylus tenuis TaxID=148309 RepID=A0AAD5QUQ2_PARTN|nr:hypothetical protein KIN20_022347 [Parelaphostrongylus tenuis]
MVQGIKKEILSLHFYPGTIRFSRKVKFALNIACNLLPKDASAWWIYSAGDVSFAISIRTRVRVRVGAMTIMCRCKAFIGERLWRKRGTGAI